MRGADYQIVPIDLAMGENKRADYLRSIRPASCPRSSMVTRVFENAAICLYSPTAFPRPTSRRRSATRSAGAISR
jgi:hypothetical protein